MINESDVEKAVLLNAIAHGGKASTGPVISSLIGKNKELLKEMAELKPLIEKYIMEFGSMSLEELQKKAKDLDVSAEKKDVPKEGELKDLPDVKGEVVLRLPPEPSGYMHLGHAISGLINYMYKEKYNGKIWLRFEDTNPNRVKQEFVDNFKKGYTWLGIRWDHEKFITEDMERIYAYGETLLKSDRAYVCTCDKDDIKNNRMDGKECSCRGRSVNEDMELWKKAREGGIEPEAAIVRAKMDMHSRDMSLRDPGIFRIIKTTYRDYNVWPLYDFASVIEDELCGITHIIRSNEFKNVLQSELRKMLGFRNPVLVQFSRYNFKGTPFSKRKIRALVEAGEISGWDDIRLPTMSAIMRRGIRPEAFREFVLRSGYSESKHEYSWDSLFTLNRRIIDPTSRRLFFVSRPVKLVVDNAPEKTAKIKNHPSIDMGEREIKTNGVFFIESKDIDNRASNNVIRLKDLFNVKIDYIGTNEVRGSFYGEEMKGGEKIIQWVTDKNIDVEIQVVENLLNEDETFNEKSLTVIKGIAEEAVHEIKEGETVQFERFGFCVLDDKKKNSFIFVSK